MQGIPDSAGRSDVKLVSVAVNGKVMSESDYQLTDKKLILKTLPEGEFKLSIETVIKPQVELYSNSQWQC